MILVILLIGGLLTMLVGFILMSPVITALGLCVLLLDFAISEINKPVPPTWAEVANRACKDHGGVDQIQPHIHTVICKDGCAKNI